MIIEVKTLQELCKNILLAVDNTSNTLVSEVVELSLDEGSLSLNVTNGEYYVSTSVITNLTGVSFKAVVGATKFLNLISKITTDTVDLTVQDNSLVIKANGKYKIPMMYEDDHLVNVTKINIENETSNFDINLSVLQNILAYNSKELLKIAAESPANKLYYIDESGCITYNSGACITYFNLPSPVKLLLSDKVVKLFKLFKDDVIHFSLGIDMENDKMITKISLSDSVTKLTSIVNSDSALFDWIPSDGIRASANEQMNYSMVVDKDALIASLGRLGIFSDSTTKAIRVILDITSNKMEIFDITKNNSEEFNFVNPITNLTDTYSCGLYLNDLMVTLKNCTEKYLTITFGNHRSMIINRNNVKNIISECEY